MPVGVRVCQFIQDEMLEVLFFEESVGVLGERCRMFCFTTPRSEGLELNSSKFQLAHVASVCVQNVWKVPLGKFHVVNNLCVSTKVSRDLTAPR